VPPPLYGADQLPRQARRPSDVPLTKAQSLPATPNPL